MPDAVEGDTPTMTVRSTVVVEEVAVAFCLSEILVAKGTSEGLLEVRSADDSLIEDSRLLDIGAIKVEEETCAVVHCERSVSDTRKLV